MPVKIGTKKPDPDPMLDVIPDIAKGSVISQAVTHWMEAPEGVPPDFDDLPEEEKERIRAVQRFQGLKLRSDIKDRTIPLTKDTMDIP